MKFVRLPVNMVTNGLIFTCKQSVKFYVKSWAATALDV